MVFWVSVPCTVLLLQHAKQIATTYISTKKIEAVMFPQNAGKLIPDCSVS